MNNSNIWYKEIMSIKIPNLIHKDLSKILLIFYVIKENSFNKMNKISDLNRYIYRFYIDNNNYAKLHPSIVVNSISHYGAKDLLPFTVQVLEEWKNDNENSCLNYDEQYFWVNIDDISDNVVNYTKNIANMLFIKATNHNFDYDENIDKFENYNLDIINNSKLKNRVLEDIQYCVCCDEIEDLRIINISNDFNFINNKNNYLTVCNEHYKLFMNKYFKFKSNGYIQILKMHPSISEKMHISNSVLNTERKKILDNLEK